MKRTLAVLALFGACGPEPAVKPSGTPRMAAASALLDGWIYAIGGYDRGELASVEAYRPATRLWKPCAPMAKARAFHAGAAAGGRLFVFGGLAGEQTLGSVEIYDPVTDRWTPGAPMATPRNRLAAAEAGGKIYVVGGMDAKGNSGAVEIYDPATNRWSLAADLPTPRHGHGLVVLEGKLVAIGGYATEETGAVEEYDPATDTWTAKPPLKTARGFFGACVLNGKIYVYSGRRREPPPTEILGHGGAAAFPEANCRFISAAVGKCIYVIGGETEGGKKVSGQVWTYELERDAWSDK